MRCAESCWPFASQPHGATLSDSAWRTPSEIPSRTRSVSVFLFGRASVGPRSFGNVALSSLTPLEVVEKGKIEWLESSLRVSRDGRSGHPACGRNERGASLDREVIRSLCGWRGERDVCLTHPPRQHQSAGLRRARATEGPHRGMGGVSTVGLFAATGPQDGQLRTRR